MKKKTLTLLTVIALAVAGILIMNACTKNESNVQTQKSYRYVEFMPSQEDVIPLIKDFNAVYKNYEQGLKSGTDYPLNEALWNLEAGVNYSFCEENYVISISSIDSSFFTTDVKMENGNIMISNEELMSTYGNILNFTSSQLNSQKKFLVTDISLKSINNQEVIFKVTTVTGNNPSIPSCNIENDDYWYFANGHGKCGSFNGQQVGKDASTRMNFLLNCIDYACNGSVFFTGIQTLYGTPAGGDNEYTCYNPSQMQMLYDDNIQIIEDNRPENTVYIDCIYTCDLIGGGNLWGHVFDEIRYGVLNCKPDDTK